VSVPADKLRLGGMALRNGILVHSFDHWAAAVRTPEGTIAMASGRKPELPAALVGTPFLRGVARMAEAVYLLPIVRRRLPEARLPIETPGLGAALAGSALLTAVLRRSKLPAVVVESVTAGVSLVPALAAIRGSQLAGYHGAEHKAIGGYEQDTDDVDVAKEHERCGSHMVGPLIAASVVGNALVSRMPAEHKRPARIVASLASIAVATEAFAWMTRHRSHPLSRALATPGFHLQRLAATREPTADELEVARSALHEVLRLEGAPA